MPKEFILYNLRKNITEEEYRKYCSEEKGPFIRSLPSCKNFTITRIKFSKNGGIPYRYVGVVEVTSTTEWLQDTASRPFQEFLQRWFAKIEDFLILIGDDFYQGDSEK